MFQEDEICVENRFLENAWYSKFLKPLQYNVITTQSTQRSNTSFTLSLHIQATYLTLSPFTRQINAYGLNGAINGGGGGMGPPRTPGAATTNSSSHPRSSAGEESDEHDYYNDFDRLKVSELHFHQSKLNPTLSSLHHLFR